MGLKFFHLINEDFNKSIKKLRECEEFTEAEMLSVRKFVKKLADQLTILQERNKEILEKKGLTEQEQNEKWAEFLNCDLDFKLTLDFDLLKKCKPSTNDVLFLEPVLTNLPSDE